MTPGARPARSCRRLPDSRWSPTFSCGTRRFLYLRTCLAPPDGDTQQKLAGKCTSDCSFCPRLFCPLPTEAAGTASQNKCAQRTKDAIRGGFLEEVTQHHGRESCRPSPLSVQHGSRCLDSDSRSPEPTDRRPAALSFSGMAHPALRVPPSPLSLLYPICDMLSCRSQRLPGETHVFSSKACELAALHVLF